MSLMSLDQTMVIMTATLIDAGDITPEITRKNVT